METCKTNILTWSAFLSTYTKYYRCSIWQKTTA